MGVRFPGATGGSSNGKSSSSACAGCIWPGVSTVPRQRQRGRWNYSTFESTYNPGGPPLEPISNDGSGPMPQPGDVLSYGATSSAGHASVVTGTDIDAGGNGTVAVVEENASADGWDTVPVTDWILGGFDGGVSGCCTTLTSPWRRRTR